MRRSRSSPTGRKAGTPARPRAISTTTMTARWPTLRKRSSASRGTWARSWAWRRSSKRAARPKTRSRSTSGRWRLRRTGATPRRRPTGSRPHWPARSFDGSVENGSQRRNSSSHASLRPSACAELSGSLVLSETTFRACAMTLTDEVRSFNRFYTREIGLLNRRLPATDLSLPEARVLYELARAPAAGRTAAEIGRALGMDKAHLSRILARFRARGLMQSVVSPDHGKHRMLTLTDAGRTTFAAAEAAARGQVDALLMPIDEGARERLAEAMRDIRAALNGREAEDGSFRLRPLRPGDVGWI